jgi:hypothetical protein
MMAPVRFKSYGTRHGRGLTGSAVAAAKVDIYTKMFCGYCYRAKRLLTSKGVDYVEY